jgi:thymidylate synthase
MVYVKAKTIDDLLRRVYTRLFKGRERISPKKGDAVEVRGALLRLTNPRARLSRTETKGMLFSALGELLWYLSGSDRVEQIAYYISMYRDFAEEDGSVHGAYGPRLFALRGIDQLANMVANLKRPDSRQCVIQLFSAEDVDQKYNDVPCTCTLQFFNRGGKLDLMVHMRSNDAFAGLPHDVFAFTMIQEIVARCTALKLGEYIHSVGSLHLYDADRKKARAYLAEGWQEAIEMPRMPVGDPWPNLKLLLAAEAAIRQKKKETASLGYTEQYWGDLDRLLRIFSITRGKRRPTRDKLRQLVTLKNAMSSRVYEGYIRKREIKVERLEPELILEVQ